jgi:hypothetical protein
MFLNMQYIWINSEYHPEVVWCLSTGKELDNTIFYAEEQLNDKQACFGW